MNQKEILDRKTVLLSKPRKLNVALTTRCNISCIMCEVKKITWEIPEKTIREIALFFPYLERIIWQGGEVFLFDSFKEILREAGRHPNITHEITTNSHMIDEGWIEIIKKINLDLNISIDGFSEATYEYIRRGSKFSDLIKTLNLINEARRGDTHKVLVLIFTVIKSNFKELDKIVDFAKRYHFNRIIIQPVKGNHQNEENIFYHRDTAALKYIEGIKGKLKKEAEGAGIDLAEWLPTNLCLKDDHKISSKVEKNLFCNAPWEQLFIEWGGKVYPHCLCLEDGLNESRVIGNVLESTLTEIWNGERMQSFRKKIIDNQMQDICCYDCVSGLVSGNLRNLPLESHNLNRFDSNSFNLDAALERGKDYIGRKDYELATEQLREVILVCPDSKEAHFELGKAYYLQDKYPEAEKELQAVRRIDPNDINARLIFAKIYKATRRYELAFEEIKLLFGNMQFNSEVLKEFKDIYPSYIEELKYYNNQGKFKEVSEKASELYRFVPDSDVFYRNKLLSELEIAQRKPVVSAKMRNLIVTLSTACNLNCVMCEERRLNWQLPRERLKEVISYFPYLERIVWQGGEAFVVEYFDQLLDEAKGFPHLRQVITTNGLLIDEKRAEKLVKSNVDITFSIDGITKEVYEAIRKGARFETLIKNLVNFNKTRKKYNNLSLNTNLHVVIMKSNYRQLQDYIDFAREYEFKLLALLPIGGNYGSPENIFYSKDKEALNFIEQAIPKLKEKAEKYGILLENRLPVNTNEESPAAIKPASITVVSDIRNKMLCHLPWIQLYIDYDGTIRPDCVCRPEESIGNVAENSLSEVWNNKRMQLYRKMLSENRCEQICNAQCVKREVSERYLKFS